MGSYNHDADVIVYNYKTRATEVGDLAGFSIDGAAADPLDTDVYSLREAIVGIQVNKSKGQPHGSFMITLKATQEWTKVIVPGSWCAIFMADHLLSESDLTAIGSQDAVGNVACPLKMIGLIMSVRVQKQIDPNGSITMTYSISGFDFGYVFTSSIHINHVFQADVVNGLIKGPLSELSFPKDKETYGDPAENVQRILEAWSKLGDSQKLSFTAGDTRMISPPPIRMSIPQPVADLVGTGTDVMEFVGAAIGVDTRDNKVMSTDDFVTPLVGEKFFMVWQLIVNNTLWGMINQYLNPLLNEAYTDLHAVSQDDGSVAIQPMFVMRQIPFNTPDFDKFWKAAEMSGANAPNKYDTTLLVNLPRTVIPAEKVISYDIGYSDYDRVNYVEVNGFDIDVAKHSPGAFNNVNRPRFEEGSIKRFGLRPKVFFGADYGTVRGAGLDETGFWSPLLQDWWFNGNRYANGSIECVGLIEHVAIGENVILPLEKVLGHIESYSHSFTVDENGHKSFRTHIDFSRGISSESTANKYQYIYGDVNFGGMSSITGLSANNPFEDRITSQQDQSIFQADVDKRVSFTETNPQSPGNSGTAELGSSSLSGLAKLKTKLKTP